MLFPAVNLWGLNSCSVEKKNSADSNIMFALSVGFEFPVSSRIGLIPAQSLPAWGLNCQSLEYHC